MNAHLFVGSSLYPQGIKRVLVHKGVQAHVSSFNFEDPQKVEGWLTTQTKTMRNRGVTSVSVVNGGTCPDGRGGDTELIALPKSVFDSIKSHMRTQFRA